ncbi:hypothetical protein [Chryseobacterium arthrosphaerae]|uniref:hypothetical protein n=1 Tax=Chryseobacterium arthrosphaerae TaxID=651561 RepID=UPI001E2996D2|nr:hypothetical protein [Chryseobacterium arthrosphaerae]UEQ75218.1 hypothetical protein J8N07_16345 [Chryseobacterium arthrosphaerae]
MMETLELREIISKEWRTDDFIRKQLLCNKLKYSNQLRMHFILDYNINDYDGIAEEKYIKDDNESNIYLKTYLNKNAEIVDLVQTECEIKFVINAAQEQISCQLIYFFHRDADREELRRKKAIILETFSYEEFRRLVMHVGFDDFENYYKYKNYFTEIFKSSFLKAKSAEELKFLYSKAPEFVLQGMALENEMLFGHLLALTKLDDTGIFSGWKDGSSALVNVLKAFPDHIFLLNKFRKSPELCNRIYFNLDGTSEFNGEMKSNRLIFATILMQYCLFSYSRPKAGAPTFRIGNEYKVNTEVFGLAGDILGFGKSDEKTFFLQQQKEVTKRVFIVPKEGDPNATEQVTEDLDEGAEFYPLDMVYFIKQQTSETNEGAEQQGTIMMVPAIYVKAWADAEKWEDINETIRIVADMVGVVFGIGTLALSGNPYLLLAAAADLSLALPDLTIQAFRAEIAKLPGGDEFLRQWDLIYNVLGSAVAAPQLVVGLAQLTAAFYRSCLSLLRASVNVAENVKQGLRASAISVFLDLNSGTFQRKDLRMFSPTEWVIPSAGFISKTSECDALIQNGAFFMELDAAAIMESINKGGGINPDVIGAISSNRKFALVYKGEIIAQGSRYDKAYQKVLQEIRKVSYSSEKVGEVLESFVNRRRIVSVEDVSLLGKAPEKGVKMLFNLLDELGNNIGQLIRSPNKNDLYYRLIFRGKEIDIKSTIKLLDDKYRLRGLPIKEGEHLLYGDLNIPKEVTDKYSGLGQIIYEDGLKYFLNAKKYGKVDGTVSIWIKADIYTDYGGQSINLDQFWKAFDNGMSYEEAAFSTFAGKQAKKFGFTKVRIIDSKKITRDGVQLNFLK